MPEDQSEELTAEDVRTLKKLLKTVRDVECDDLQALLRHARSIDEVMKTANAFGLVGRVVKKTIIWLAALIAAVVAVNTAARQGISDWLGLS